MKKRNNFGYLFREGIHGIFLHGLMSFAAVCVTIACSIIMGSFGAIMYNLNVMVTNLEKENETLVYVDENLTEAEAKSVGSKINLIENVQNAVFVSKETALENFVEEQDDTSIFEGVDPSTFRHRFVVTLEDNEKMKQTVSEIEEIPGVAKVSAHYEISDGFLTIERVLRIVSVAIIIVLLVVSMFIISNTVKLAMYDRRDEIAIMKIVGATNAFIRWPYVVEGFLLGIFGASIAFGLEWLFYDVLEAKIVSVDSLQLFTFVPFTDILWIMVPLFILTGLFVGVVGSILSIRKFLDV